MIASNARMLFRFECIVTVLGAAKFRPESALQEHMAHLRRWHAVRATER
jgi:hypothetical protein